jgi:hypothetical protein
MSENPSPFAPLTDARDRRLFYRASLRAESSLMHLEMSLRFLERASAASAEDNRSRAWRSLQHVAALHGSELDEALSRMSSHLVLVSDGVLDIPWAVRPESYASAHQAMQGLWLRASVVVEQTPGPEALPYDLSDELGVNISFLRARLLRERVKLLGPDPLAAPVVDEFIPEAEDLTMLAILRQAGCALTIQRVVKIASDSVREARKAGKATELVTLSERKLRDRRPILLERGFVAYPVGRDGEPMENSGVGITEKGRALLERCAAN